MTNESQKIEKELRQKLMAKLGYKNIFQAPKIVKVVVSAGIGRFKEDDNAIKSISDDLQIITGQKPKINLSKKSVSSFKLRTKQPVGLTVTLRGKRMYDFISKLTNVAMPRIRDFKGIKKDSFDGEGNYCFGISEQIIMPEIKYDSIGQQFGFQVNIKTTAKNDNDAKALLTELGFPFEKDNTKG